ncbi:hypothetical protein [Jiangella mangrovi]|uniref:Uncharacterized protein n=1 Tax=Jiangella mangrovi TaxID=1524084 RepID=A0A7W9LPU6_9ACTN|nr:hypothetical protein [Jiangella mangrovi]MBB5791770.1 hypothetical protein [Jiangella mangrovi]
MAWWYSIAMAFDLLGLLLAAIGFNQTWNEHGVGKLWDPWRKKGRVARRRLVTWVRRVLRRPAKHATVRPATARLNVTLGAAAIGTVLPRLPDVADLTAFAAAVQERLNELNAQANRHEGELRKEIRARELAESDMRADLGREIRRVEGLTKRIATGGLRMQIVGWSLVLVGTVLGGVANLVAL